MDNQPETPEERRARIHERKEKLAREYEKLQAKSLSATQHRVDENMRMKGQGR